MMNGWHLGDQIKQNDTVIAVETDKTTVEVPSPFAGIIDEINRPIQCLWFYLLTSNDYLIINTHIATSITFTCLICFSLIS